MDLERVYVARAGARRIDPVVFQPRIARQRDMRVGVVERGDVPVRDVMLDDGRARTRCGVDDDARMRRLMRPLARRHMKDDQGLCDLPGDLQVQAIDEEW